MKILEIKDLKKSFGEKEVLKDISFDVEENEIVGFLGRNGAGKSTTMKLICGLLDPDGGEIKVCGYDIEKDRVKVLENLGVSIESPALYQNLTGRENLKLMGNWRKVSVERIREMEDYTRLDHNLDRPVRTYSMGMKMRLMLSMALMAKPKLLILDEPMNGLDPDGVFDLREKMKELKNQGCSILFSSHQLAEVEKVSDRVVMIEKGQVVYNDILEGDLLGLVNYSILTNNLNKSIEILKGLGIEGKESEEKDRKGYINISIKTEDLDQVLAKLIGEGILIKDIEKLHKSLEELYKELRGEEESIWKI